MKAAPVKTQTSLTAALAKNTNLHPELAAAAVSILPASVPYRDLYEKAGKTCPGISARLLAAQGKQESGYNPRAKSHVGAMGIAQFMPSTWKVLGKGGDPWNPADAIPAQARYMCGLYDRYGSADAALIHYNGGSLAVTRWKQGRAWNESAGYLKNITAIERNIK